MTHFESVDSYDADAPLPVIGSRWVWEIDEPAARALIEVLEVRWNGEEWWVRTKALLPDSFRGRDAAWNDVGRFWEAVTIVGGTITQRSFVRLPEIAWPRLAEPPTADPEVCTHPREMWRFRYTTEDWIDGDEDDVYECRLCGKRIVEYVPR